MTEQDWQPRDPLLRDWRVSGKNGPASCYECGDPAVKQSCYPGEPWVAFCERHDHQYVCNTTDFWIAPPKESR
jgi:hypothetical protein